ncbi:MAG: glycosyltransferase family 9 protein [Dysgonamonadaceae bacterium]|nr:glycosyltransferase family 9 protein [Dysgonamonadaceae bacterium]
MTFKKRVNTVRGTIMHGLTQNIGNRRKKNAPVLSNPEKVRRILISRPNNRLGNQLLLTPLVQEIRLIFPDAKIDLFVRGGIASVVFENYENVDRIIRLPRKPFKELIAYTGVWLSLVKRRYDLVINAVSNSSSGRLSTAFARAKIKLYGDEYPELKSVYNDYDHIAKTAVYNLRRYLSLSGCNVNRAAMPVLDVRLTPSELAHGKAQLDKLVSPARKSIALYTYATGGKCYPVAWWTAFYEKLKEKYGGGYHIIEVLPIENVSQIAFRAPAFYSKDIREIAALMANTVIYIGADCGIMHLASAAGIPVAGLFAITNTAVYGPYNAGSVAINTNRLSQTDDLLQIIGQILTTAAEADTQCLL